MPAPLDGVVLAVLGLDTRPQARPHFRAPRDGSAAAAAQSQTYPPNQVADIYQFPAGTTGAGQTIAVGQAGENAAGIVSRQTGTYQVLSQMLRHDPAAQSGRCTPRRSSCCWRRP